MCSTCKFLTDNLDLYGKPVNLHLFGKEKYKTKPGMVMSLFTIITILSMSLFFLKDLFNHKVMTIIFNQDEKLIPMVNMTNMPIMFTMTNTIGDFIKPERLYNFDLKKVEIVVDTIKDSDGKVIQISPKVVVTPMGVEPCDREKHIPEEYFKRFDTIKLTNFYCVANMSDVVIYGRDGDYYTGFSALQLYLNRCENSTLNNNSCYDEATIDQKLTNVYVSFNFLSYQVDHYNYTQPQQLKIQTITSEVTSGFVKRYRYYLNQVLYNTDYGFMFESFTQENFHTYNNFELEIETRNSGLITSTSNFVQFSFRSSDHVNIYSRSYQKIQNFLANIGGFFKAVIMISEFIVFLITRKFYLLDLSNEIFNFKNQNLNDFERKEIKTNLSEVNIIPLDKSRKNISQNNLIESNNISDLNNNIRKIKKYISTTKYSDKLYLSYRELICPKFCFKNKMKIQNLEKCENFIIKNISVENIIEKFYELDNIIKNIINENKYKEIKENKKILFRSDLNTNEIVKTMDNIKKSNSNNEINLNNLKLKSFSVNNKFINMKNIQMNNHNNDNENKNI